MRGFVKIITYIIVIVLTTACGENKILKQQVKTLDSLCGSINTAANGLKRKDSLQLKKLLGMYSQYSQFINVKVKDTILKSEAVELKSFYESGEALEVYKQNRSNIITRLNVLSNQMSVLSYDIARGTIPGEESANYFNNEISEAKLVMQMVLKLEKDYDLNIQKFTRSFKTAELLIKQHNNNKLPTIINSESSL